MKAQEIRELSKEDLATKEKAFKKELFELENQKRIGAVEKPHRFKVLRRDIARIMTVIKERERDERRKQQEGK